MKEGKIEKIKPIKEKTALEKLIEFKDREVKKMKEDKTGGPWNVINPEDLTEDVLEIYDMYLKKEYIPAKEKVAAAKARIEGIDIKKRDSNREFLNWIDDIVGLEAGLEPDQSKLAENN